VWPTTTYVLLLSTPNVVPTLAHTCLPLSTLDIMSGSVLGVAQGQHISAPMSTLDAHVCSLGRHVALGDRPGEGAPRGLLYI
jgi:hypothetical protein